jgi:dihydropyrimidinase
MLDLVIKSGRVVTPHGVGEYDVGIQGERIVCVEVPGVIDHEAKRIVDVEGKIVVPGGIEPHAHINWKIPQDPTVSTQKAQAASRACAFGGTTTIIDSAGYTPCGGPLANISEKQREWAGNTYVDYTFHCVILGNPPAEHLKEIPEVIKQGVTSVKVFTYSPSQRIKDGYLYELMNIVSRSGGIIAIYAENDEIIQFNKERLKQIGQVGYEHFHLVHTGFSEEIEFRKAIFMAERADVPIYFVHVSSKEGVKAIAEARAEGLPVYGETTHLYLAFSHENYLEPDGVKYHCYPALKSAEDREALWAGLAGGSLLTVGTTDVTTSYEVKVRWKTIFDARGGHNGIETRLPYLFSEGVVKKRISLERFVDITSTNVAKIFGMYPKKGVIAPGAEADIIVIDQDMKKKVRASDLHADSDYSVWDGWEFQGWPVMTLIRGKIVVEDGKLLGSLKDGRFVARTKPVHICEVRP